MLEQIFYKLAAANPNVLLRPGEAIGEKLFKHFSRGNMKGNLRNREKFNNAGHGIAAAGVLGTGAVGGALMSGGDTNVKLSEFGFHKGAGLLSGLRTKMPSLNRRVGNFGENAGRRATDFRADGTKMVPRKPDQRGMNFGSSARNNNGVTPDPSLHKERGTSWLKQTTGRRSSDY